MIYLEITAVAFALWVVFNLSRSWYNYRLHNRLLRKHAMGISQRYGVDAGVRFIQENRCDSWIEYMKIENRDDIEPSDAHKDLEKLNQKAGLTYLYLRGQGYSRRESLKLAKHATD